MKTFADYSIDIPAGASGQTYTRCPRCSASRKKKNVKCLSVNVDGGLWCCHHCGWSGGLGKESFKHEPHWRKPAYRKPEHKLTVDLPEKVITWFADRGITPEVLSHNKIGYGTVYMPQVEDFVSAIQFPYYRTGELVNIKYRDLNKNFRLEVGAERILYGLDDIEETTIIVEGEIDKLSLECAGFTNCVSVPNGAPAVNTRDYSALFDFLDSDKERIDTVKTWILAVDNDPPGHKLEEELARRLGKEKCKRVRWPLECKDADDILVSHGPEVLRECIEQAKPFPITGVFSVADVSDKIDHLYENGFECGVSTGWATLDQYYTVRPGELTVITGIPSSGKSNWADALLVNLAKEQGWRFAIFSPENQPLEDHMARIIEKWGGMPFKQGPTKRMDKDLLEEGKNWADEHFSWILPDDGAEWTLEEVLEKARVLVFRKGIKGLIIDPWNEMEHERPAGMSETEYISRSLKHIRQFARHKGIHIWIVAHPTKLYKDKDGNYPVPTPYDISGSAAWRNKSDNCLTIWRDFTNTGQPVDLHVQKIRFRQIGKIGLVSLTYNRIIGTYQSLDL